MTMNGDAAENLPQSPKQKCLNIVGTWDYPVGFQEDAAEDVQHQPPCKKVHSSARIFLNHCISRLGCTATAFPIRNNESAQFIEKITADSERNDTLPGSWEMAVQLHSYNRRKDKFVCIFVPLPNEWQVYSQSPQSLSKGKLFDMMLVFVCSDFRNIYQHTKTMWNSN